MNLRAALALGFLASIGVAGGCTRTHSALAPLAELPARPAQAQFIPASTQAPAFVTLGAGDMLGQRIHVFDVYLASRDLIGPIPQPIVARAPEAQPLAQSAIVWAPLTPVTGDVALAMVTWQ